MCEKMADELPAMQAILSPEKIANELDYSKPDVNPQSTRPSTTPDSLLNDADGWVEFKFTKSMDDERVSHYLESSVFGDQHTLTDELQMPGYSLDDPDHFERLCGLVKDDDDVRGDGVCRE